MIEALRQRKEVAVAALVAAGSLAVAGCGASDLPTDEDFEVNTQIVVHEDHVDGTGDFLRCRVTSGSGFSGSQAWAFYSEDCDYAGTSQFPGEQPAPAPTP